MKLSSAAGLDEYKAAEVRKSSLIVENRGQLWNSSLTSCQVAEETASRGSFELPVIHAREHTDTDNGDLDHEPNTERPAHVDVFSFIKQKSFGSQAQVLFVSSCLHPQSRVRITEIPSAMICSRQSVWCRRCTLEVWQQLWCDHTPCQRPVRGGCVRSCFACELDFDVPKLLARARFIARTGSDSMGKPAARAVTRHAMPTGGTLLEDMATRLVLVWLDICRTRWPVRFMAAGHLFLRPVGRLLASGSARVSTLHTQGMPAAAALQPVGLRRFAPTFAAVTLRWLHDTGERALLATDFGALDPGPSRRGQYRCSQTALMP